MAKETEKTAAQDSADKARAKRMKTKTAVLKKIGEGLANATSLAELKALTEPLKAEERNAITHQVRAVTERIVNDPS